MIENKCPICNNEDNSTTECGCCGFRKAYFVDMKSYMDYVVFMRKALGYNVIDNIIEKKPISENTLVSKDDKLECENTLVSKDDKLECENTLISKEDSEKDLAQAKLNIEQGAYGEAIEMLEKLMPQSRELLEETYYKYIKSLLCDDDKYQTACMAYVPSFASVRSERLESLNRLSNILADSDLYLKAKTFFEISQLIKNSDLITKNDKSVQKFKEAVNMIFDAIGFEREANWVKAIELLKGASEKIDFSLAQLCGRIGLCYREQTRISSAQSDCELATNYISRSDFSLHDANYFIGTACYFSGQYKKAIIRLKDVDSKANPDSLFFLAQIYINGREKNGDVNSDYTLAQSYLRAYLQQDNPKISQSRINLAKEQLERLSKENETANYYNDEDKLIL